MQNDDPEIKVELELSTRDLEVEAGEEVLPKDKMVLLSLMEIALVISNWVGYSNKKSDSTTHYFGTLT